MRRSHGPAATVPADAPDLTSLIGEVAATRSHRSAMVRVYQDWLDLPPLPFNLLVLLFAMWHGEGHQTERYSAAQIADRVRADRGSTLRALRRLAADGHIVVHDQQNGMASLYEPVTPHEGEWALLPRTMADYAFAAEVDATGMWHDSSRRHRTILRLAASYSCWYATRTGRRRSSTRNAQRLEAFLRREGWLADNVSSWASGWWQTAPHMYGRLAGVVEDQHRRSCQRCLQHSRHGTVSPCSHQRPLRRQRMAAHQALGRRARSTNCQPVTLITTQAKGTVKTRARDLSGELEEKPAEGRGLDASRLKSGASGTNIERAASYVDALIRDGYPVRSPAGLTKYVSRCYENLPHGPHRNPFHGDLRWKRHRADHNLTEPPTHTDNQAQQATGWRPEQSAAGRSRPSTPSPTEIADPDQHRNTTQTAPPSPEVPEITLTLADLPDRYRRLAQRVGAFADDHDHLTRPRSSP